MPTPAIPRNRPCYPVQRMGVEEPPDIDSRFMPDSTLNLSSDESGVSIRSDRPESVEGRWIVWGRSVLAVAVVAVLIVLGVANIAMHARWHEVEDGVLWTARAEG